MAGPLHLVFTLDRAFIQHCGVTLASVFANNPSESFTVHLIFDEATVTPLKKLTRFIESRGHTARVHFFDKTKTKGFKVSHHVTAATYYRLFLADLLTDEARAIYMDSDLIVPGSILELWQTDLAGAAIAAVREPTESFFNAGVMVVDLDWWRKNEVSSKSGHWIAKHNDAVQFWDQDVLNAVLENDVRLIPEKWNFKRTDCKIDDLKGLDVRIVHFAGGHKPWNFYCEHPLKGLYFEYLAQTPWRRFRMREETFMFKMRRRIKVIFAGLGLVK